jgi:hypothetical protein
VEKKKSYQQELSSKENSRIIFDNIAEVLHNVEIATLSCQPVTTFQLNWVWPARYQSRKKGEMVLILQFEPTQNFSLKISASGRAGIHINSYDHLTFTTS